MKVSPSFKKWFLTFLVAGGASAPLSVAAACSSNDDFIDYEAYLTRVIKGISIANYQTTLHDDVQWSGLPVADDLIFGYEYLSGDYSTIESAQKAPDNLWSALLPRELPYKPSERHVWVRARTKQNPDRPVYQELSNLSANLNLAQIRTHVDADPNFSAINFNRVVISGTVDVIEIDESKMVLPQGVVIWYNIQNQKDPNAGSIWRDASSFKNYLSLNRSIFNDLSYFRTIAAKLVAVQNFVITDDKRTSGQPNISGVKINTILSSKNIDTLLQDIKVAPSPVSYNNEVFWNKPSGPALSSDVKEYKFLTGAAYSNLTAVKSAPESDWKDVLPKQIEYNHNKRYLWVRVTLADIADVLSDQSLRIQYYSITATSLITQVKTNINSLTGYDELDLSKVTITGRLSNLYVDISRISTNASLVSILSSKTEDEAKAGSSPSGFYIAYQYEVNGLTSEAYTFEKFRNSVSVRSRNITNKDAIDAFIKSFRVSIVSADTNKFAVSSSSAKQPNTDGVRSNSIISLADLNEDISRIRVVDGSTIKSARWINPFAPPDPNSISTSILNSTYVSLVQYFYGYYPSLTSVQNRSVLTQPNDINASKLPADSISATPSQRYLWIRIFPIEGQEIPGGGFYDITEQSGILKLN